MILICMSGYASKTLVEEGFGFTDNSPIYGEVSPLERAVLIVNTPQIVISTVYLVANHLLTCMLITAESQDFGNTDSGRKPLRTTWPAKGQRGSYFLQVPLRYAIPTMATMVALHYCAARS